MADYLGSYNTSSTVRFYFTTHAQTGAAVAPSSAFEAADIRIYKDGSATQRSSESGYTMTSPFDSVTGLHAIAIDLSDNTDAGFYAAGSEYAVVLVPDETVDSLAVVRVLAYFSIERVVKVNVTQFGGSAGTFSSGRPEVNTTHAAGTAWASGAIVAGAIATGAITSAKFAAGAIDAAAIADNAIDAGALAADCITAAKIADGAIDANTFATGAITATAIAADAIGASELASDAATEIATAVTTALGTGSGLTTLATAAELAKVPKSDSTVTWNATALASIQTEAEDALAAYQVALVKTTIATLSSQTSFTLTAGSADNDAYNGCEIVIQDASTATQKAVGVVLDYVGSSKTITLLTDPAVFTMAATDIVTIHPSRSLKATVDNRTLDVSVGGEAGLDWANVGSQSTSVNLSGTTTNLVNTVTTYTGNTPQTGDSYAIVNSGTHGNAAIKGYVDDIGTAGAGLTAIPWNPSWDAEVQSEVEDGLNNLGFTTTVSGRIDAAISTRATPAQVATELVTIGLDHLVSASVTGTDVADNSIFARLVSKSSTADWDTYTQTTDSLEALRDRGDAAWITATGFSTHSAADVWAVATRVLTAGTNIVLAKGTGVTGFTDIDAAGVRTAVGLASANLDTQLGDLPTNAELATSQAAADDATLAAIAALSIPTSTAIADAVLSRNVSNVESSAGEHTLCTVILAGLESSISGTTLTIKRTDGTTTHATKTLTKTAGDDPIRGIS